MLRPMVATTAVTAALILVAGCGGSDKKSDSGSGNGGQSTTSATPSTPTVPSFDPPKALTVAAAFPSADYQGRSSLDEAQMGIAGQVALIGGFAGLSGHDVANPNNQWMIPSKAADTTTVSGASKPMAAKIDGKDVAVVAYAETDKGNGTQKPKGLVVVQWIDVMSGKKIGEVSTPVSTVQGEGDGAVGSPSLMNTAYDPETGQVAVGVSAAGSVSVKSIEMTVFADPKTQKSTVVPGIIAAAVANGVVAGAKAASPGENSQDAMVLLVDGASGKVTKQIPAKEGVLKPVAGAAKHAYFYGSRYTNYGQGTTAEAIISVDLSTGAMVQTVPAVPFESDTTIACYADQATSVVCATTTISQGPQEIMGFDDATGKKVWGFTSKSGSRVVPTVTAAYHGVVYAKAEAQPVLLDAKSGQDLPSAAPSGGPSSSDTPSSGVTPSSGDSPSTGDTPSESDSPSDNGTPGNGDLGLTLYNGKQESPVAVSPFGGVYRQLPTGNDSSDLESVCIFVKATA
ncbi:hypothetical protein EV653_7522 [Kribbella pratensis]|uniref:Pyrroloquinoline-quinone binding quinoprotein n=2 Tax=Kribbella pratensis TaxID=2512112 RepID=A0A4R8BUP7_9ACTN|nr:hypothetical protein EV653_7522 [Kribbella pratensis]